MKLRCKQLNTPDKAILFWEEEYQELDRLGNVKAKRRKVFKDVTKNEEFDVADDIGHELMHKYKGALEVVHYGDVPDPKAPIKKLVASPKNAMIKDEQIKEA